MTQRTIVKQGKNFTRYSDGTILVKGVRFSYPHVFVAQEDKKDDGTPSGKKSYSLKGLAPKKTHADVKAEIVAMMDELIQENKGKFKKGDKLMVPPEKKFFKDGDKSAKETDEGMWTMNSREQKRPSVRGPDARPLTVDDQEMVYGGCWGNILLRPWFQAHKEHGIRINCNLVACQVTKGLDAAGNPRPGAEPFGEGRLSEEEIDNTFEAVEEDDDDGYVDDDLDTGDL